MTTSHLMQAALGREYNLNLGLSLQPTTFSEAEGISSLMLKGDLDSTAQCPILAFTKMASLFIKYSSTISA